MEAEPKEIHHHTIRTARRVPSDIAAVWEAWTDPVRLEHWFTDHAEQDLRVGGHYSNSDGDNGTFLEIEPPHRLKFTWEQPDYTPGSVVTVEFAVVPEGGTEVRIEHDRVACDDTEDLQAGWEYSLDSLTAYLATGLGIR